MLLIRMLIACLALLALTSGLHGQDRSDIKSLIDQLASKNKPPKVRIAVEPFAEFPRNFNWKDQDRIIAIIESLTNKVGLDWTVFLDHMNDQRYCITTESDQSASNATVGSVCRLLLVNAIVAGYEDCKIDDQKIMTKVLYPMSPKLLREYLEENRDKKLVDIQKGFLMIAIKEAKVLDFKDDNEKAALLERFEARLGLLNSSGKAILPKESIFNKEYRAVITKDRAVYMK